MLRAFSFGGCDGIRVARPPHSPFLFRIRFGLYIEALEKAFRNPTAASVLAKTHGQLRLEVLKKEIGWTSVSWEFDFSRKTCLFFRAAFQEYCRRYGRLFRVSSVTKIKRVGFPHFCGTHGLTLEGRRFLLLFRFKAVGQAPAPRIKRNSQS